MGFIGSCLANLYVAQRSEVFVYDNGFAGKREFLQPQVNLIEADIIDHAHFSACIKQIAPSIVFHLAAYHFIPYCNAHPEETLRVNVEGCYAVLRACQEASVARVVLASSGAIYDDTAEEIGEDAPIAPFDVYGLSKQMAEQCAEFFAKRHQLAVTVARFFNTYGPNETQDHLIPAIIRQLQVGDTVRLGNIITKRDFIFVEDVAAALMRLATMAYTGYLTVNVGTGQEYSAREIVEMIGQILARNLTIKTDQLLTRQSDKLHQRASTERLQRVTGWTPRYSLRAGLTKLLQAEGLLANHQQL